MIRTLGGARRNALAAVAAVLAAVLLTGTAQASRAPLTERHAATAAWTAAATAARTSAAPTGEFAGTLRFAVAQITPAVVTSTGPAKLTLSGTITNTGTLPVTGLQYRFQRGAALADAESVDAELSQPTEPDAFVSTFVDLATELPAGGSMHFVAAVPITGAAPTGLDVRRPAVYPLMLNVNGDLPEAAGVTRARVGEVHLLLTVLSAPLATAPADGPDGGTATPTPPTTAAQPVPVALFWPFTDRPHLGVGGVFLDDTLATSVRSGGRLDRLLTQLSKMPYPEAVSLVVDPMLLDELDRMTRGYWVSDTPGTPQPALTPPTEAEARVSTSGASASSGSAGSAGSTPTGPGSTANPPAPLTSAPGTPAPGTSAPSTPAPATSAPATSAPATPAPATPAPATSAPGTPVPGTSAPGTPVPGTSAAATGPSRNAPSTARPAGTVAGTGAGAAAAFLAAFKKEAARHRVLSLPYSDADAVALVRSGMDVDLRNAARSGREVIGRVLGPGNVNTTVGVPPGGVLDDPTASVLTQAGYTSMVLAGSTVRSDSAAPVGALQLQLDASAGGGSVPALVGDSPLLPLIGDLATGARGASSAVRANTLAAQLAQRSFDGDPAPVAYLPTQAAAPSPAGYLRLTNLLAVLARGGAVVGGDPSGLATAAIETGTLEYPASQADELPSAYLNRWKNSDIQVTAVRAAISQAAVADSPDPDDLTDELSLATAPLGSAALRTGQQPGELVLSTIESSVAGVRGQVNIRATAGSYTLASGTSPLVLTVKNDLPYDVSLRVVITGGARNGLTAKDPGLIQIAAKRTKQVPIPTTVARSGTFQIGARLIGPDGSTWGAPVVLRITSTAYGTITVILVAVAGGVLLLMVIFRISQRWRNRRREPEKPPDGPAPDSITAAANNPIDEGSQPRD